MAVPKIEIRVIDRHRFRGELSAPLEMELVLVWMGVSTGYLDYALGHDTIPAMMDRTARVLIDVGGRRVFTGRPATYTMKSGTDGPDTVRFQLISDWSIFENWLAWPTPKVVPADSGTVIIGATDRYVGDALPAAHYFLSRNMENHGATFPEPVILGNSFLGGGPVDISMRFHPMSEQLMPAVAAAGGSVWVTQRGDTPEIFVWFQPTKHWPQVITPESGGIKAWETSYRLPQITHGVIAAEGEGSARWYERFTVGTVAADYALYREMFIDARDLQHASEEETEGGATVLTPNTDWPSQRDARIAAKTEDLAERSGLKIELDSAQESLQFSFWSGPGVCLGDEVDLVIAGKEFHDRIRKTEVRYAVGEGVTITPVVGEWVEDTADEQQNRMIRDFQNQLATLGRA